MPRTAKTWAAGDPITSAELNKVSTDLDTLFTMGGDRLLLYKLSTDGALVVRIGAGTYRVGVVEGQYAGGTVTVGATATTYVMINSAGAIQTSTSAWNGQYTKLGVIVSSGWVVTSVTPWRNDAVGWELGAAWFQNVTSTTYTNWLLTWLVADGVTWTLTYEKGQLKSYTNGVNTWTFTYTSGRRISSVSKT